MARPNSLDQLSPEKRRTTLTAARRAATLTRRIAAVRERHEARVATLESERAERWREATGAGMSATEAAKVAGLHHSAVDRALSE